MQADPISGMHCWLQRVTITPAEPGDSHGDVHVDTARSAEVYREWLAMTRAGAGAGRAAAAAVVRPPGEPRATAYGTGT